MPLTPLQKQHKRERDNLNALCNRISSAFNFHTVRTWRDVYRMEGLSNDAITARYNGTADNLPTYAELRVHFNTLKSDLEDRLSGKVKPPDKPPVKPPKPTTEPTPVPTVDVSPIIGEKSTVAEVRVKSSESVSRGAVSSGSDETGIANDSDYGLHPSPKEKAYLYWFQKKATAELWKGITGR